MKLYSYYRSTAAYRVRIALNYKQIAHDIVPVNLVKAEQHGEAYLQHNMQARVPTLDDNGFALGQSMAILEYLEEKFPKPALLPEDIKAKAWIRYFSQIIVSDIHPLNNFSVIKYLSDEMGHEKSETLQWYHHWLQVGFDALEAMLKSSKHTGSCCYGDEVTLADICLIPQIYNAHRFEFSMDNYPLLNQINDYSLSLPYFETAKPENQPDAMSRKGTVVP